MDRYLQHYGIPGMKWGVRRYENPDGTLTEAGKKRYKNSDGTLTKFGIKKYEKDVRGINTALNNYKDTFSKYGGYKKKIYNPDTGNTTVIADRHIMDSEREYRDIFDRTMSSLEDSDYTVGYNFVNDSYYLRKRLSEIN